MTELCEEYNNKYKKYIYCSDNNGIMITNTYDCIDFDNGYIIFSSQDHSAILRTKVKKFETSQLKYNIDKIVMRNSETAIIIYGEKK